MKCLSGSDVADDARKDFRYALGERLKSLDLLGLNREQSTTIGDNIGAISVSFERSIRTQIFPTEHVEHR